MKFQKLQGLLAWRDEYCVGVERIDRQHRQLLEMIAGLSDRVADEGERVFAQILDRLDDYAQTHFAEEEALARRLPGSSADRLLLLAQCNEHADYRRRVLACRAAMARGEAGAGADLLAFVARWWLCHILGTDRALGRRLLENGID